VGIACLRLDYGSWDEGYGEREDVRNAVRWAREEYNGGDDGLPVGLFGYSFGASLALLAAADTDPDAVAVLAPTARLADDLDALAALESLEAPVHVCYGERDATVDWEPIVERARERGDAVTALSGDHFFGGEHDEIAGAVGGFSSGRCSSRRDGATTGHLPDAVPRPRGSGDLARVVVAAAVGRATRAGER